MDQYACHQSSSLRSRVNGFCLELRRAESKSHACGLHDIISSAKWKYRSLPTPSGFQFANLGPKRSNTSPDSRRTSINFDRPHCAHIHTAGWVITKMIRHEGRWWVRFFAPPNLRILPFVSPALATEWVPMGGQSRALFAVLCVWCGWLLPTPECVHVRVRELGGSLLLI